MMRPQYLLTLLVLFLPLVVSRLSLEYGVWKPITNTSNAYVIEIAKFAVSHNNKSNNKSLVFQSVDGGDILREDIFDAAYNLTIEAKDEALPSRPVGKYVAGVWDQSIQLVWNLWREGTALEIVDSSLGESYLVNEVVRCFQIALLCVQDYATDRPTMSAVLVMLSNDAALATPREPAFVFKRTYTGGDPSTSTTEGAKSYNDVTCTIVEAR